MSLVLFDKFTDAQDKTMLNVLKTLKKLGKNDIIERRLAVKLRRIHQSVYMTRQERSEKFFKVLHKLVS